MMNYDKKDKNSILEHSRLLEGKTLKELNPKKKSVDKSGNKGKIGELVEEWHFGQKPNSSPLPDFPDAGAGVELKVSPLRILKRKRKSFKSLSVEKGFSIKEDMKIKTLNGPEVEKEGWDSCSLMKKIPEILTPFYIDEEGFSPIEKRFDIVRLWKPSEEDMKVIKNDWLTIQSKIKQSIKLSASDTNYLSAKTSGTSRYVTYNSTGIKMKERCFYFKRSYIQSIYESLLRNDRRKQLKPVLKSIVTSVDKSIEGSINRLFSDYIGKTVYEIEKILNMSSQKIDKGYLNKLCLSILRVENINQIEEFLKADIKFKTIRLSKSGASLERISFKCFEFKKIMQQSWDESWFKNELEHIRYCFPVFRLKTGTITSFKNMPLEERNKNLILEKVVFWNMPEDDLLEVKEVHDEVVRVLKNELKIELLDKDKKLLAKEGEDVKKRKTNLPTSSTFNAVAHVGTHSSITKYINKDDLPNKIPSYVDMLPNGDYLTKHSFWLNKTYIEKSVAELLK